MRRLFRITEALRRDPAVQRWLEDHAGTLGGIARRWFEVMRECGSDVREVLHDGHPTACVEDAAFGYVNVFQDHVNVGFFNGAVIAGPGCLLEGTGRFMRHVKIGPGREVDDAALVALIETSYADMKRYLKSQGSRRAPPVGG